MGSNDSVNCIARFRKLYRSIPNSGSNGAATVQSGCIDVTAGLYKHYSPTTREVCKGNNVTTYSGFAIINAPLQAPVVIGDLYATGEKQIISVVRKAHAPQPKWNLTKY